MQSVHVSPYAGQWYPADRSELHDIINSSLARSAGRTGPFRRPGGLGFVVPHAAPMYSGTVAAASYRHVELERPSRIVLLGFSHRRGMNGIAAPSHEAFSTPLGVAEVDTEALRELQVIPEPGLCDHSVDIQFPFIQTVAPQASVVPLYVGRLSKEQRSSAARRLRCLLDGRTVFLASSDLTHYGAEFGYLPFPVNERTPERLKEMDEDLIAAASSLDPDLFIDEIRRVRSTVCGSEPIALLLETLNGVADEEVFEERLDYQTSGEIVSDYSHSVSYAALGYFRNSAFQLSAAASADLIESVRKTVDAMQATGDRNVIEARDTDELSQRLGAFVTIYQQGRLQGCIGRCREPEPLFHLAPELGLSAALDDNRFDPLRRSEPVDIEISILTPFKRVRSRDQVLAGEHGAYLEWGSQAGLLLPKVASERDWNTSQFLTALARKMGLPDSIYQEPSARLSVFRAQVLRDV